MTTAKSAKKSGSKAPAKRSRSAPARREASTAGKALNAFSIGALAVAAAAGAFELARRLTSPRNPNEHVPEDLLGDAHPGPDDRAPDAFRPDPTAPVPPEARDAFRPALVQPGNEEIRPRIVPAGDLRSEPA